MKHTPGPWKAIEHNRAETGVYSKSGVRVAGLKIDSAEEEGRMAANARLIAAAPDLLAACDAVVKALDYRHASPDPTAPNYVNPAVVAADRAIAERLVREAVAKAADPKTAEGAGA